MNSTVYSRISRVYFQKDNEGSSFNYVYEFEDDNDEIVIKSPLKLILYIEDGLETLHIGRLMG